MMDMKKKFGVDYTPLFIAARYTDPLHTWKQLCSLYIKTDDPADYIDLNKDNNLVLAADILARKLNDTTVLDRIGKHAIEQNWEVASRYTTEENLKELGLEHQ